MINRNDYLEKIKSVMWDGKIKVVTGLRRSGKSTLLFKIFYEYLLSSGVKDENILQFELDKMVHYIYRNPLALCELVEETIKNKENEKFYLFIDEIQLSKKAIIKNKYESDEVTIYDMLNELKDYPNLDVYVIGSNSKMLSSDIATEFRGRSSQIHVYPLSFKEVYSYFGGDEKEALNKYMLFGGMPETINKKTDRERMEYLNELFSGTYLKDLVEHGKIQREDVLSEVLNVLASSISSLTNPNNISNAIGNAKHEKIDSNMVSSYIEKLKDAFLIQEAKRYDVKGKSYFTYPNKYYYQDIGLRNIRLNYRQFDPGHIMENIIYNELIRRGYNVDVGVVYDRKNGNNSVKEIDFVVNDLDKRIYIQSAFEMSENRKTNSELVPFTLTGDYYKKIVIRNDIPHHFYDENGFLHCNLIDFLLERVEIF